MDPSHARFSKDFGGSNVCSSSNEQQMEAFKPTPLGMRKVILATNIAETSVTIPGVHYVVDPGLVKACVYDSHPGLESLMVVPVSQAQALQRSGRAGREGPGKCFRFYTEDQFHKLKASVVPEIERCNLANVVLQLKALKFNDVLGFDFPAKPSRVAILKFLEQLYSLGALTEKGVLSNSIGKQMASLPVEPAFAKALLVAADYGCTDEMLATVAMLSDGLWFVNTSIDSFFLSIVAYVGDYTVPGYYGQIIWTANRYDPVRDNAILRFDTQGNFVLQDWDGRTAWSSNTSGDGVQKLLMDDNGKLALLNAKGKTVWQSFDHPVDTLLLYQAFKIQLLTGYWQLQETILFLQLRILLSLDFML